MKRLLSVFLALALLPGVSAQAGGDGRRVLTLAAVGLDGTVERAVNAFNGENPDYRIQVTDYYDKSANDADGALAALEAGKTPDLFDLGGLLAGQAERLAAQGRLADLTGFIDADPDIRWEDYLPAVWDAATVDGRVYAAAPAFSLTTLACRAGDVPAGGMTWERFVQMAEEGRPLCLLADTPADRARLLEALLRARFADFVDEDAGVCAFDSQAFIDMLALAGSIPCSDEDARLAELAIQFGYEDLSFAPACLGGEPVFCGWPGTDGPVGYLGLRGAAGMSADTDCPEGCWAFLRSLLLGDVSFGGLPARLDRQADAAGRAMADAGVSQGQIDAINGLMGWTFRRESRLKSGVLRLAYDAASSCYGGQTDAAGAAAALQAQASVYIAEQRGEDTP